MCSDWIIWLAIASVVFLLVTLVSWVWHRSISFSVARQQFALQRPQLQELFFQAAASSGKPRGLRWNHCEWGTDCVLVREKASGKLAALTSVQISFAAIPGSDMEGLDAVQNLRCASAVFFFHQGHWHTTGKALFNLNPDQAIKHMAQYYERLSI